MATPVITIPVIECDGQNKIRVEDLLAAINANAIHMNSISASVDASIANIPPGITWYVDDNTTTGKTTLYLHVSDDAKDPSLMP